MFQNLNVFQTALSSARHAGARQALISQNMANADTPGYRARDLMSFRDVARQEWHGHKALSQLATRDGHLNGTRAGSLVQPVFSGDRFTSPNKNNVSIEDQMLRAVNVRRQHDRALAVYRAGLNILRSSLGKS